jgi:hypothetical protein
MAINAVDLALFTTSCFNNCIKGSHEYFCFIMIVLGIMGSVICTLYVGIIEYAIFKESRKLNVYYSNGSWAYC